MLYEGNCVVRSIVDEYNCTGGICDREISGATVETTSISVPGKHFCSSMQDAMYFRPGKEYADDHFGIVIPMNRSWMAMPSHTAPSARATPIPW